MNKDIKYALTFDDILLVPQYSEVIPSEVKTKSFFARDKYLEVPIISAAMDTVTGHKVARVMAQLGGLGIIHKNFSIEKQANEIEKVKKYESGIILDPITLSPDNLVKEALDLMKKYSISGVPITVDDILVGILTNRDLRFEVNLEQPIMNIMTKENLITTHPGTTLQEAKKILQDHRIEKLPVVNKNQKLIGLITIKDIEKAQTYPLATKDIHGRLFVGAAIGAVGDAYERVEALVHSGADVLVIDTAHGYSKNVLEMTSYVTEKYKDVIIVAGNVVTEEASLELIKRGADVIKVGVGPGSICTTRIVAGVGVPQITAIMQCSKIAKKHGKSIISDGGIKFSGDITKALALGANSVMIGALIAGVDESPGELIIYHGRTYKVYRGMGSLGAMEDGSKDRYSQFNVETEKLVPEGIEGRVTYKGSASAIIHQLIGGVRSGMGYLGANDIQKLQEKAEFVFISSQGLRESHVHDIDITKEAPNYRLD